MARRCMYWRRNRQTPIILCSPWTMWSSRGIWPAAVMPTQRNAVRMRSGLSLIWQRAAGPVRWSTRRWRPAGESFLLPGHRFEQRRYIVHEGRVLKDKLEAGKVCLGVWNSFCDPCVTELLCGSGFDFLMIDSEHGPLGIETIQYMIMATKGTDTAPIVR